MCLRQKIYCDSNSTKNVGCNNSYSNSSSSLKNNLLIALFRIRFKTFLAKNGDKLKQIKTDNNLTIKHTNEFILGDPRHIGLGPTGPPGRPWRPRPCPSLGRPSSSRGARLWHAGASSRCRHWLPVVLDRTWRLRMPGPRLRPRWHLATSTRECRYPALHRSQLSTDLKVHPPPKKKKNK